MREQRRRTNCPAACPLFARLGRPIVSDPTGEALLIHLACCESKNHCRGAFGSDEEIDIVQAKEHDDCDESSTLVAVDKRMVAGNAEGIRCRKRSEVRFAVSEFIDGPAKRRFEHALVTHTV